MNVPAALPMTLKLLRRIEFPHKLGICERLFAHRLEKLGEMWVETGAGVIWKLDLANVTHRWMAYGAYEGPYFQRWCRRRLKPDSVVIDSGANIGQVAIYLARVCPEGRIFAFEPGKEAAAWLRECLVMTPLPITVVQLGLSDHSGPAHLAFAGPSVLHGAWGHISQSGEVIEVVTLDQFARDNGLTRIALWKLDMEGHEPNAVLGASELLRRRLIGAIWCEVTEGNQSVVGLLESYGYRRHCLDAWGRPSVVHAFPVHGNSLFLPHSTEGAH